jgi:hypothetical protein
MQNLEEDKVLESQGLAAMTFTLNWSDGRATHEDEMHVENSVSGGKRTFCQRTSA